MRPSTVRLPSRVPARSSIVVLGDARLLGGVEQRALNEGGLPSELSAQAALMPGREVDVDVAWDLRAALSVIAQPAAAGRLDYGGIVVAVPVEEVLASSRRLAQLIGTRMRPADHGPCVVVVLAAADPEASTTSEAKELIERLTRPMRAAHPLAVLRARTDPRGVLAHPGPVATEVLDALRAAAEPRPSSWQDVEDQPREVAVDRSLRALTGRTDHLQRAVVLAQNSFDAPYAQLNLVSRGTLRSLAFIGRSSDGLQQSLSAEAVRRPGPLLIADTHAATRWTRIPEVHGPAAIRYFAGHPVHSPDGHRIGVLCVLDTRPHDVLQGDDVLIRDLALLAEGELAALID